VFVISCARRQTWRRNTILTLRIPEYLLEHFVELVLEHILDNFSNILEQYS
jgi:hypothetical protein